MSLGQQTHWQIQHGPSTIRTVSSCALFIAYFGFHGLHLYNHSSDSTSLANKLHKINKLINMLDISLTEVT